MQNGGWAFLMIPRQLKKLYSNKEDRGSSIKTSLRNSLNNSTP